MNPIVIIGKSGQLAYELARCAPGQVVCLGRDDVDITDACNIEKVLDQLQPAAIINASAYTAVDKAESDADSTYAINEQAVRNLAAYCQLRGLFLVHVSTDYVFNGLKGAPYTVDDDIAPQGVYGASKAAGEAVVRALLPESSCIIRTSWVYSSHGNNFVKTMLKLMADKPALSVIDDQVGSPTWARGLAMACLEAVEENITGVFHWSDEGVCSWYDFALAIQELGMQKGLLENAIPVHPIPTRDYPTPAKRPHYSVLDKTLTRTRFENLPLAHWRKQLSAMLDELATQ
ncbi:dTDP-4-dehydrorhamnose reductase [Alteromonas aestuariivivens]|uniref:dTDP-4-dehydrorhamnose reductase n=1 Tax=Alteromonas aestuariivivens TaxID=1938339 RepID=A0A3D8M9B1_9ALTE|nr:dTDP-4-dehydrorhamnose reductase [Alteromonas aestuariivivens]RDV26559.1 dTDP-4-dehydrorhamnose reductase [Alteromonas aestuariivivens]